MSHASEEYINQEEAEYVAGSITALPSPISQAQYDYIVELMGTSVLADCQKNDIQVLIDSGNLTSDHANKIVKALLDVQKNPLSRVKDGELLLMKDVKIAIHKAVNAPNT